MDTKETKALLAFAEDHNCIQGCNGCIGESKDGCNHPEHPENLLAKKQDLTTTAEAASYA